LSIPVDIVSLRLFIRLLIGCILLSTAIAKLAHLRRFRRGIQDYQIIPPFLEKKLGLSTLLTCSIPIVELFTALGLISGVFLLPAIVIAICLFLSFSAALALNLARGRRDLSCHCEGVLGNHYISWWHVRRNGLFLLGLCILFFTPQDQLTLESFIQNPALLSRALLTTILPVMLFIGILLIMLLLVNSARVLWSTDH